MKTEQLWAVFVFVLMVALTSCSNESENPIIPNPRPQPNPGPPPISTEAPGLVGTFSGTVQNIKHTKSGTLTISITKYDRSSGALTGTLTLKGFPACYTTGIFPDPNHKNYNNRYSPNTRGFGFIQASGIEPGSYSYLYFERSTDFYKGLKLGIDELGFRGSQDWCLSIDPVLLKRL